MGTFLGVLLIILVILFAICSCKVASWVDQDMDDVIERRNNEKKDLYSNNRK